MYTVDFVGLACFSKRDGRGRIVLLPDGRQPPEGTDPHIPRIVVPTAAVESIDDELAHEEIEDATVILLPKCTLSFEGTDVADEKDATLDTTKHDPHVQELSRIDRHFDSADERKAAVRLRIRKGDLQAFRFPGTDREDPDPAVVSRLTVWHDDPVTVVVRPDDGEEPLKVLLKAETEIVLANAARRTNPLNTRNHFLIYETLSTKTVDLSGRHASRAGKLDPLPATNPFFKIAGGIGASGDCGNTGCCPKP